MAALSAPYDSAHPSLGSQMYSEWSSDSGEEDEKDLDLSVPILHRIHIPPSISCGRYNFQGCSRNPCEHEHVWDRGAQVAMAEMLCKSNRQFTKGLHPFAPHAPELDDLNNRHEITLTCAERQEVNNIRCISPYEWNPTS